MCLYLDYTWYSQYLDLSWYNVSILRSYTVRCVRIWTIYSSLCQYFNQTQVWFVSLGTKCSAMCQYSNDAGCDVYLDHMQCSVSIFEPYTIWCQYLDNMQWNVSAFGTYTVGCVSILDHTVRCQYFDHNRVCSCRVTYFNVTNPLPYSPGASPLPSQPRLLFCQLAKVFGNYRYFS